MKSLDWGIEYQLLQGKIEHERMVQGLACGVAGEAQAAGGIGLGVAIDDQGPHVVAGEGRTQIDGGSCLADPAFLIGDGDDSSQRHLPAWSQSECIKGEAIMQAKGVSRGTSPGYHNSPKNVSRETICHRPPHSLA